MLDFDQYRFELFLTCCSAWAALQLTFWPAYLHLCSGDSANIHRIVMMRSTGVLLALGTLSSGSGICLWMARRVLFVGLLARMAGVAVHGFFWLVSGISLLIDAPHVPTNLVMILMGLWGVWALIRIPARMGHPG